LLIFGRNRVFLAFFLPFWLIFDDFWQNGSVFANQCERRELLIFNKVGYFWHFSAILADF